MGISREKEKSGSDSILSPPSLGVTESSANGPKSPDLDQASAVFWLKFTIVGIIALNLLFAVYALKSDRFVTRTQSAESDPDSETSSEPAKSTEEKPDITPPGSTDANRTSETP